MPHTSAFVQRLSDVFGSQFDSIVVAQNAISEVLLLLNTRSVVDFLKHFDEPPDVIPPQPVKDGCFIEVAEISEKVLGKKTAFNQSRRYYSILGGKVVRMLSILRHVLEESNLVKQAPGSATLAHLAWSSRLYTEYVALTQNFDDFASLNNPLPGLSLQLFGEQWDCADLGKFNARLSRFLLKWRFVLTRIQGDRVRFAEAFAVFMERSGLAAPQYDEKQE